VTLRALITRPEEDAKPLAEALAARGIATVIEPLLAIAPLPEAAEQLAGDLAGVQAILFTSANGARTFAQLSPRRDIGVLAVGDATALAARGLGFAAVESAGGDVQDLVRLVNRRLKPDGGPLFHAAGSAVAGDLAQLLAADGFTLRRRMLYESQAAQAFGEAARAAFAAGGIDLVLLFSPRTAATFASLAKSAKMDAASMTALCLSPAVAAAVKDLSWRAVETAARPDLPAMLALVDRQSDLQRGLAKPEAKPAMTNSLQATPPPPSRSPIPAAPAPRQGGGQGGGFVIFLAGLVGALIAGGGMLAILHYAPQSLGIVQPAAGVDSNASAVLTQQIADVSTRLAELQQQVTALPKPPADLPLLSDRIAGLQSDVAALKSASAAAAAPLPVEITGLPQRLADLEVRVAELKPADLAALSARVTTLEQRPAGAPADSAALNQLKSDVAAFDTRLKAAESAMGELAGLKQSLDQLAASAKASDAAAGAGIALTIDQLHRLIADGKSYGPALDALAKFSAADTALSSAMAPSIAALRSHADSGLATLAELQAAFPAAAEAISRAAAASSENAAPNASFTDRVLARLASLVTIRPVGEGTQGEDPPARLARAEARLGAGDMGGAAGELAGLPAGGIADAAKPWLDRAQARLEAEAALDKLQSAAIAALAAAAPGAPQ
jgi:uroporphyrinogen-III synthase